MTSEKIIDYAKDLFLTVDENGKPPTITSIFLKVRKKYGKNADCPKNETTIRKWREKYFWDAILQTAKNLGQEKSIRENSDKESEIVDKKANDIADRRTASHNIGSMAKYLLGKSLQVEVEKVKAGGECSIDYRTLNTIVSTMEDVVNNLDGVRKPEEDKLGEIYRIFKSEI